MYKRSIYKSYENCTIYFPSKNRSRHSCLSACCARCSSQRRAARNLFKEFESIEGENLPISNRNPTKSAPFLSSPDTLGASSSCLQLEHITEDPCLQSLADNNNQAFNIINKRVSFDENYSNSTRKCNVTPTRLTKHVFSF